MSEEEPNVLDNEDLYTSIVLGGVRSPGVVTLSEHDRTDKWDVQAAGGNNGASTSRKGDEVTFFNASFYLARDNGAGVDDYYFWPAFRRHINKTVNGSKPQPVDVYHPDLAENGIKSVCRAKIGGRVYDQLGGCTIVVKFIEYRPAQKKGGSPSGSKTDGKKDDPNAAALAELEALIKKNEATPWT